MNARFVRPDINPVASNPGTHARYQILAGWVFHGEAGIRVCRSVYAKNSDTSKVIKIGKYGLLNW